MRVRSNDIRRSKADKNKNNISKIYVHLAVVARVDLWDASYSIPEGARARSG